MTSRVLIIEGGLLNWKYNVLKVLVGSLYAICIFLIDIDEGFNWHHRRTTERIQVILQSFWQGNLLNFVVWEILYYKIQSVCVSECLSVSMLVRNRLPNHAYYSDEAFAGDSVGLGLGQRLNFISEKLILRYFWGKIDPDEKNTVWASLTSASLMLLICFSKFWIGDNLLLPGC